MKTRITSAHALAALALVASCAGTSWAAASISSKQVLDNSLRGSDIRNGSLTGLDLADGSVRAADVGDGEVGAAELADGSVGTGELADGAVTTAKLAANAVDSSKVADGTLERADLSAGAAASLSNRWEIRGTMKTAAGGEHVTEQFLCDVANGERAAGGGGYSYYAGKGYLTKSTPVYGSGASANEPIGWEVSMQNLVGTTNYLVVRVTCVQG